MSLQEAMENNKIVSNNTGHVDLYGKNCRFNSVSTPFLLAENVTCNSLTTQIIFNKLDLLNTLVNKNWTYQNSHGIYTFPSLPSAQTVQLNNPSNCVVYSPYLYKNELTAGSAFEMDVWFQLSVPPAGNSSVALALKLNNTTILSIPGGRFNWGFNTAGAYGNCHSKFCFQVVSVNSVEVVVNCNQTSFINSVTDTSNPNVNYNSTSTFENTTVTFNTGESFLNYSLDLTNSAVSDTTVTRTYFTFKQVS